DVADVEQADLALVDGGEGVGDEWVEAGLVDLDVEDAAAAGGHRDGLHVVQRVGGIHVPEGVGGVQDRADDVKVGVERRAGVYDPEADELTGVCREWMLDVLPGVAVERHPVRLASV